MPFSTNPAVTVVSHSPNWEKIGLSASGRAGALAAGALVDDFSTRGGEGVFSSEALPASVAGAHPGGALLSGRMIVIDPARALSFVAGVNEPDSGVVATSGITGVHAEGLPSGDEAIGPGCHTVGKARFATAGTWPT